MSTRSVGTVLAGVAAVALAARVSVPVPGSAVPQSLQTLAVVLVGARLGPARGAAALAAYLLVGALGLPVFADGAAGPAYATGPTAGYLSGFVAGAAFVGWWVRQSWGTTFASVLTGMATAHLVILAVGWLRLASTLGAPTAFATGVAPFLWGGLVKSGVGALVWVALGPSAWGARAARGADPPGQRGSSPGCGSHARIHRGCTTSGEPVGPDGRVGAERRQRQGLRPRRRHPRVGAGRSARRRPVRDEHGGRDRGPLRERHAYRLHRVAHLVRRLAYGARGRRRAGAALPAPKAVRRAGGGCASDRGRDRESTGRCDRRLQHRSISRAGHVARCDGTHVRGSASPVRGRGDRHRVRRGRHDDGGSSL